MILFPMQIFQFWFYTKLLDRCLAIVNCSCFMSQKIFASKHILHILCTKVQNFLALDTFFLKNMLVLTKIRPMCHLKSTFSVKKETVLGLGLSLDVLIYIIRYSKPKLED